MRSFNVAVVIHTQQQQQQRRRKLEFMQGYVVLVYVIDNLYVY